MDKQTKPNVSGLTLTSLNFTKYILSNTRKIWSPFRGLMIGYMLILAVISNSYGQEGSYVSGHIGLNALDDAMLSVPGLISIDMEFDPGFAIGGTLGYDFGDTRLETELAYRSNDIDKFSGVGGSIDGDGDFSTLSLMINGFYEVENETKFTPYIGGGIGFANVKLELFDEDDDETVFAYQLGLGIGYEINESVTLDLGYRYFATMDPEFEDDVEAEYISHNVLLSIRFMY